MAIIYKISNRQTGKFLIGVTKKDLQYALKSWMGNCTRERYKEYAISKDCKLLGKKSFDIVELETCDDYGEAFEIADAYIEQLGTLEPYGYNKSFLGIRKHNATFYDDKKKEAIKKSGKAEIIQEIEKDEAQEDIMKVDFRKKNELLQKYGITGISRNEVPQVFAEKETIKQIRELADNLEKYGSNEIYEFVPSELNDATNNIGKELLSLLGNSLAKQSKNRYVAFPLDSIQCQRCGAYRDMKTFFFRHPDKGATRTGYIHICRDCIKKYCDELFRKYNSGIYTILVICQLTNVIFVQDAAILAEKNWIDKKEKYEEIFRYYMSELNYVWLNRESAPTTMLEFRHSNFKGDIFGYSEHHPATPMVFFDELNEGIFPNSQKISVNQQTDLEMKWGKGFEEQEYMQLEEEYDKLEKFLPKKTDLHIEALKKYIIYSLKEKQAMAKSDLKEVKDWNALADKAADNAQLKLKQLSDNFGAEVDGFAKLVEAIEEYDSVIPVLPKVRKMPYDDIDFLIWESVNYNRRLEGKPEASYEDVYNFIDDELTKKMVDLGMNDEQIKKEKEKRNAIFNDLPDNYNEPLWMLADLEDEEDDDDEGDSL